MKLTALPSLALLTALASHAFAGPLKEAKINQIVNDVKLVEPRQGARPAVLQEVIKEDLGVATGVQSRAELIFQDDTLTRLGAETFFSFQPGTRDLNLERGSMLLQVPKNRGGARIRAASVTASITGTTVMVDHLAGGRIKLTVLEGSMTVMANAHPADKLALRAGKQVIVNPDAKSLPAPTDVNLRTLIRDSVLTNPVLFKGKSKLNIAALPSMDLIEKEMDLQDAAATKDGQVADASPPAATEAISVTPTKTTTLLFEGEVLAVSPAKRETPLTTSAFTAAPIDPTPTTPPSDPSGSGSASDPLTTGLTGTISGLLADKNDPGKVTTPRTLPDPGTTGVTGSGTGTVTGPGTGPSPVAVDPLTTVGFLQPDWAATSTTAIFTPMNTPPVTAALANTLIFGGPGAAASFDLTGALPQLTLGTRNVTGAIYGGNAMDGSATLFAFRTPIDFDAQVKFDARFGVGSESAFPAGGVATFRFVDDLTFGGSPAFAASPGGTRDLALIVGSNVHTATTGGGLDLSGLHSLTVATGNGGITLGTNFPVSVTAGSGLKFLYLYASGEQGNATLKNAVNLPGAGLFVDAQKNLVLTSTASVNVDHAAFNSGSNIYLKGPITADTLQFNARQAMTVSDPISANRITITADTFSMSSGSLTAGSLSITTAGNFAAGANSVIKSDTLSLKVGGELALNTSNPAATRLDLGSTTQFDAEARDVILNGSVVVPSGATGTLKATTGKIDGPNHNLTGFDRVQSGTDLKVKNLDTRELIVANSVEVNGKLSTVTATVGGDLKVSGTISPRVGDAVTTMHVISAHKIESAGGLNFKGTDAGPLLASPTGGSQLTLIATLADIKFETGSSSIASANFDGGSATGLNLTEGGDGGTLLVGTAAAPIAGKISVNTPISATTGANGLVAHGGNGGTVEMVATKEIELNAPIKVSDSAVGRTSKQGGKIRLESRLTSGTAINVTNSGQLLSLLAAAAPGPGGKVEFVSAGGDILVNGGTVVADKGTVDIRNNGAGKVALTNANIRGDVVKIGALGANGQLLVGGGTISADTSLKLYGGTSNGSVRFTDNVTLGGESTKIIAGKTVTIDSNKTVTVGGSTAANVYTDNANYTGSGGNGSTSGKFGGKGATTQGFSGRPAF